MLDERLFDKLFNKRFATPAFNGKVTQVSKGKDTCRVEADGKIVKKARLHGIVEDLTNKVVIYPKVGSYVLCLAVNNKRTDAHVVAMSEPESIEGNVQGYQFRIDQSGLAFGNEAVDLKTQKDALIQAILKLTVPTAFGPSGTPINSSEFTSVDTKLNQILNSL